MKNNSGFTLLEVLIAAAIMSIGLLALSETVYLSWRQSLRAEEKTVAVNLLQIARETDLKEISRIHSINMDFANSASATPPSCGTFPCDPFTTMQQTEVCIAVGDPDDFNYAASTIETDAQDCVQNQPNSNFYLIRQVLRTLISGTRYNYTIVYGLKSRQQMINDPNLQLDRLNKTVARNYLTIMAAEKQITTNLGMTVSVTIPYVP